MLKTEQNLRMEVVTNPVPAVFVLLLGALFIVLFISWCCKQCSRSKEGDSLIVPPNVHRRYITAIDVQTGLPVIIHTSALLGSSSGRPLRTPTRMTGPYNSSSNSTLYGTILYDEPQMCQDVPCRTPPPPYSEASLLPRV
ncbi:hypothetical protein X975_20106, partial [Stegodyphus mimosarum]